MPGHASVSATALRRSCEIQGALDTCSDRLDRLIRHSKFD